MLLTKLPTRESQLSLCKLFTSIEKPLVCDLDFLALITQERALVKRSKAKPPLEN